jgi:hypothetical protein
MHLVTGVRESGSQIATDATGTEDGELHSRRTPDALKGVGERTGAFPRVTVGVDLQNSTPVSTVVKNMWIFDPFE